MHSRCKLLVVLACFIACHTIPAAAQNVESETSVVAVDTSVYPADDSAYSGSEDEYVAAEPTETVVYNDAGPTAGQWQKATNSDAYSYRDKREFAESADEKPREDPGWLKALRGFFDLMTTTTGQTILWILFTLMVGYVAYRIIVGQGIFGRRDKKKSAAEETGNISEEGLLESDWEARLKAALAAGDTRMAIRYSYMNLLQALQERGLIVYRPDKTNTAYFSELTESMKQPFRTVSRQYEYTWYGNFLPEAAIMAAYMQTYEGLKKSITYA